MAQESITLIVAGLGIAGSLSGVILGQRMSRSWQREQWMLDRRVEEFRELLDALSDDFRSSMMLYAGSVLDPDMQRQLVESHSTAMRLIRSRIFVFDEVVKLDLEMQWTSAINHHRKTLDLETLSAIFTDIRFKIVGAARQSATARPKTWFGRLFKRKRKMIVSKN